jgi:hypothetical protein
MAEIRAELKNIKNVKVNSSVVSAGDDDPKVITKVSFQFEGEPSEVEKILMAEAQHQDVHADLYSPQTKFEID